LKGPFRAEALGFFIVHEGGGLTVELAVKAIKNKPGQIVCRFFDADEKQVKWEYNKVAAGKGVTYRHEYGKVPAGVYQVRYCGKNITVGLTSAPEKNFGIMPMRCTLNATSTDQFLKAYFMIPPGYERFTVSGTVKGKIADAKGDEIASISSKPAKLDVSGKVGEIWSLSTKMKSEPYYRFGISDMPLILCGDAATAKAIGGSVEKGRDGKTYAHKFQTRMLDWIGSLKQSELELEPVDWTAYEAQLLADPNAGALFGGWGFLTHINYIIRSQNIDPQSKDFGKCANPSALAALYALDRPWNPYYLSPVLEKRASLALFQKMLSLKESDTFSNSSNNYCGTDGLSSISWLTTYYFAAPKLNDPTLKRLWDESCLRIPDRFPMFRVSCENQSSHWLLILSYAAAGSGRHGYLDLAADYAAGLCLPENNSFMKTGYQQEAYGPDATYQGLGACYQAVSFRITGNSDIKKGLKTIHGFFNHLTAPEPDGKTVFGASGFCHRTAGSWVNPQYGGGRPMMKGELEEAAIWLKNNKPPLSNEAQVKKGLAAKPLGDAYYKRLPQVCGYATATFSPFFANYLFATETVATGDRPAKASTRFTKNFNDEFIAVRTPAYYAVAYVGKTSAKWTASRRQKTPKAKYKGKVWNAIQGLSMFWTPEYGNAVLGMNWNGDTHQMLRADLEDGRCAFPDYWSLKSSFNDNTLDMSAEMFQLPGATFKRRIVFGENEIRQDISLSFATSASVKDLYEQIPFLMNKDGLGVAFRVKGEWQQAPGTADAVRFSNAGGKGYVVELDQARPCRLGPETTYGSQKMGALRISLGKRIEAGQSLNLSFKLLPVTSM
jgi:hypothetical protein